MKTELNFFGLPRIGGSSAPERKRRQVNLADLKKMERPKSLVRVIGYISPLTGKKEIAKSESF
jgi:hypothetical protein